MQVMLQEWILALDSTVCELRHRRPLSSGHQRHQDRCRESRRCLAQFLAACQGPAPGFTRAVHRAGEMVRTSLLLL